MLHTLGLPALKAEHLMTSAVIAAIPPERAAYRPHPDSRSAFDLAWHIVSAEIKYLDAIAAGVFPHDLRPTPDDVRKPSDVLAWYTERFDPALRRLETTSGDELLRMVDFYGLRTFPAISLLPLILNHTIHIVDSCRHICGQWARRCRLSMVRRMTRAGSLEGLCLGRVHDSRGDETTGRWGESLQSTNI